MWYAVCFGYNNNQNLWQLSYEELIPKICMHLTFKLEFFHE